MTDGVPPVTVHILSGSRQGVTLVFRQERVAIGRHPECQLRFDPGQDLQVSGRHAALTWTERGWTITDLGSSNGTYLNGAVLNESHRLAEGDEVRLGGDGPRLMVSLGDPASPHPDAATGGGVTQRIKAAVARQTMGLRVITGTVLLVSVLAVAWSLWSAGGQRRAWSEERDRLTSQVDSLLAEGQTSRLDLESVVATLADSLDRARSEVTALRDRLARAEPPSGGRDSGEVARLRQQLEAALVRLERQQLAASLDFESIRRRTEPAVAMIWSERADGSVSTGTALSVGSEGDLLTNRHVVTDATGPGRRLAVQYAGSRQVWRAVVTDVHDEVDLAWARADGIEGGTPLMDRFNQRTDTLAAGSPLAIIGFPHGGQPGTDDAGERRRAVVSAGILLGQDENEIRIQGYGAEGASGSPVLDRDGQVIGIVFGGTMESDGQVLLAVPIAWARQRP